MVAPVSRVGDPPTGSGAFSGSRGSEQDAGPHHSFQQCALPDARVPRGAPAPRRRDGRQTSWAQRESLRSRPTERARYRCSTRNKSAAEDRVRTPRRKIGALWRGWKRERRSRSAPDETLPAIILPRSSQRSTGFCLDIGPKFTKPQHLGLVTPASPTARLTTRRPSGTGNIPSTWRKTQYTVR